MELKHFFEGIRMVPAAAEAVSRLQISEEEYIKNKRLFQTDKEAFYQTILKEEDYRLRFLYYFSRMACDTYECYAERKIGDKIFWDTFYDLTLWCENCFEDFKEYGINEYRWFFRHIQGTILRLGRLEFEEAELDARASGWDDHRQNTIPVLNIHIPQGAKLENLSVKVSLEQAFDRWGTKVPYVCDSWLLDPELAEILPANSNIIKFQKLFHIIRTDYETREAERRIFHCIYDRAADYPEHTLLQRKAKKHLLEGKRLGNGFGILKCATRCFLM